MIKKNLILIALTAVAFGGFAHADVTYSDEKFEGGTPNYEVTGNSAPYALTQLQDEVPQSISSTAALTGTDYSPGSPSRSGIFANGNLPDTIVNEPTGQHGFVSNSQNRSLILTNAMTLVTDGVQTLNIRFSTMVYAFDDGARPVDFEHAAAVIYSELGDFSDAVEIATYSPAAVPDPGTALAHYTIVEDTWSTFNLSISNTDVAFSDTAKIRFNKLAPTNTNHLVFYDDITVTGVVSAPTNSFLVTIAPAVDPNTGHDLQWNSQAGMTYSVLTSTDLSSPVETWTVLAADLAADPPQNSYNAPADGERRFYLIEETPAAP